MVLVIGGSVRWLGKSPNSTAVLHLDGRLPERDAKQDLDHEAGVNGRITEGRLTATSASQCNLPHHRRIKPDGQKTTLESHSDS